MKKMLVIIAMSASVLSCKKDTGFTEEEASLTGFTDVQKAITNSDWALKHTALIYSPDLVDNADVEDCKKDDIYKFKLNGNAEIEFGPVNCWAGLPIPAPASGIYGSWQLETNGTILKQTISRDVPGFINGEVIYWTVDYITQSKMRIKRKVIEPNKSYTQMDTYIRK
jgi:hypothetical protein